MSSCLVPNFPVPGNRPTTSHVTRTAFQANSQASFADRWLWRTSSISSLSYQPITDLWSVSSIDQPYWYVLVNLSYSSEDLHPLKYLWSPCCCPKSHPPTKRLNRIRDIATAHPGKWAQVLWRIVLRSWKRSLDNQDGYLRCWWKECPAKAGAARWWCMWYVLVNAQCTSAINVLIQEKQVF